MNGAVGWIGVPAQLLYGCTVGDHHNPLPCPSNSSIISVEPNASELRTAMSMYLQAAAQCDIKSSDLFSLFQILV